MNVFIALKGTHFLFSLDPGLQKSLYLFIYFRLRLFSDAEDSQDQWDDLAAVITPCSKIDNSFDSGFKSQSDFSVSTKFWKCWQNI